MGLLSSSMEAELGTLSIRHPMGRRLAKLPPGVLAVIAFGALLLCIQSLYRGHLGSVAEYDDGVYFGAALNLVHGIFPYRDFTFLQPPLIAAWLAPPALLASVFGTRVAMEAARVLVDLVTLGNVVLVALLLRTRSKTAMTVGTAAMALAIGSLQASQTVLIEPFLVTLCLCATLALLDGEAITSRHWRIWLAGILFGLAGATKLWAVFPMVVALGILWRREWPQRWRLVGGTALGFALGVAPFALLAPRAFWRDVLVTQALRGPSGEILGLRLADLSGLSLLSDLESAHPLAGGIAIAILYLAGLWALTKMVRSRRMRSMGDLEKLALVSTVTVGLALLIAPSYYYHYGAFLAPYAAISAACVVRLPQRWMEKLTPAAAAKLTFAGVGVVFAVVGSSDIAAATSIIENLKLAPAATRAMAAQGCVLTDAPAITILANHFTGDLVGCPAVVDWNGVERAFVHGVSGEPPDNSDTLLQATILGWLKVSNVVVLGNTDAGIGPAAQSYLEHLFLARFYASPGITIYRRRSLLAVSSSHLGRHF